MKVKKLLEKLSKVNPEAQICLADFEGETHIKACGLEMGWYLDGEYFPEKYTADDNAQSEKEFKKMTKKPKVVCIY